MMDVIFEIFFWASKLAPGAAKGSQKQSGVARELQERSGSLEGAWERQLKARTKERAENRRED